MVNKHFRRVGNALGYGAAVGLVGSSLYVAYTVGRVPGKLIDVMMEHVELSEKRAYKRGFEEGIAYNNHLFENNLFGDGTLEEFDSIMINLGAGGSVPDKQKKDLIDGVGHRAAQTMGLLSFLRSEDNYAQASKETQESLDLRWARMNGLVSDIGTFFPGDFSKYSREYDTVRKGLIEKFGKE